MDLHKIILKYQAMKSESIEKNEEIESLKKKLRSRVFEKYLLKISEL